MKFNREEYNEQTFDSFCKRVLRNESCDYHWHMQYRRRNEISLSELPKEALEKLAVWDRYFADERLFKVMGFEVDVEDELLAEALKSLPKDRLEIVILSYFLGMSDPEIAEHLNLVRRTVSYRRTSTLQTLKKIMEEKADE